MRGNQPSPRYDIIETGGAGTTRALRVTRVGFYGCELMDRIVRIGRHDTTRYPRVAQVDCPCGNGHRTHVYWRPLKKDEELRAEAWV